MKEFIDSFVVFDLETTGFSPENNKIIEIGAIKVLNGKIVDTFSHFINPHEKIPLDIIKITNINDDMLKDAKDVDVVCKQFLDFVDDNILMGHNIMFDYKFIKVNANRLGYNFCGKGIDTLRITKVLNRGEGNKLSDLCKRYNVINKNVHRAYSDAKATMEVYYKLVEKYFDTNKDLFKPFELIYKVKKVEAITLRQKKYLLDLIRYHNVKFPKDIDNMTKSEASKAIDKIIFSYGKIYY